MNIAIYLISISIGLALSFFCIVFSMFGGERLVTITSLMLGAIYVSTTIYAFSVSAGKNITLNALALASPPLILIVIFKLYIEVTTYVVPLFEHESSAFAEACKSSGAQYLKPPAKPASSIAHDWNGDHELGYSRYELGRYGRLGGMGGFDKRIPRFDEAIIFTEYKRTSNAGLSTSATGSYVRTYSKDISHRFAVSTLTADILITHRVSPEEELSKAPINQGPVTHELTVTDRRDDQLLATLKYVVDQRDRRICGPII